MKSIVIILLIACIAAIITIPSHEKFNKFLDKKKKNIGTCLGGTRHESFKIFSLDYVDYCEPGRINKKIKTDKYIGMFGNFWKL
ncbi:MAG TPA: hypothetical protein VKC90_09545 [Chitinophagaceae bacterium]|nr:hypothetical protein [Chitinophagaceae bacterium]